MFQIGAAQVNITPNRPINLAGSFEVRRTAEVFSLLYASAVVMGEGDRRFVWVSCDLLLLDVETTSELRRKIAGRVGTTSTNVFISCTHTHNGPSLARLFPYLEPDAELVAHTKELIIQSAVNAAEKMCEARMGYAHGQAPATFNRRYVNASGKGHTNPGPQDTDIVCREGPEDQQVQVVWFETPAGKLLAVMVNFSAHPTLTFWEPVISADFPGEIRNILQAVHGAGLPVLYLQGAAGNTSPLNFDRPGSTPLGREGARRVGQAVGGEVLKIMALERESVINNPQISATTAVIDLPIRDAGKEDITPEVAIAYIREHPLERLNITDETQMRPWYFAKCMVEIQEEASFRKSWPIELSILRIGPVAFATNPGELFVEYQIAVKKRTSVPVLISELTNGYCGYIITKRAWKNGSYEACLALSSKISPVGGRMIVDKTLELLNQTSAK